MEADLCVAMYLRPERIHERSQLRLSALCRNAGAKPAEGSDGEPLRILQHRAPLESDRMLRQWNPGGASVIQPDKGGRCDTSDNE